LEKELVNKIKTDNLKDILSENLRLEAGDKVEEIEKLPKRQPITEEELNVEQLELKDPSIGNKILKRPRTRLHKDIRYWVVSPFQNKQTKFNRKAVQSFSQAFNEIDYHSERIDENAKKISSNQSKLDDTHNDLSKKIDDSRIEITKNLDSKKTELEKNLETNKTNLNDKLDTTSNNLHQKLDTTSNNLHQKLDTTSNELHQKLDTTSNELHQKLDTTSKELHQKLDTTSKELHQKLSSTTSQIEQKSNEIQSQLEERIENINKLQNKISKNFEIEPIIKETYLKILQRPVDEEGIRYYSEQIRNGTIKLDQLESVLKNSKEHTKLKENKKIFAKYSALIKKPIFIIGVPRSGTALVQSILCAHPDLAWMSHKDIESWLSPTEQHYFNNYYKWLKSNKKKIPNSDEALYVLGRRLGKGLKQFATPPKGTSEIPIEGEHIWRKYLGGDYVKDAPLDSKVSLVKEIAKIIKRKKRSRFVNKAPQNSMRLFALQKIFPDAKFINVARDPRAVVCSMMQREKEEGEFRMGFPIHNELEFAELSSIEKWTFRYNQITKYIYDFAKKQKKINFLTVRYDELISDPKKITKKILKFCDLDEPKSLARLIPTLRKKTNEKWQEKLSKDDSKKIIQLVQPSLKKMNYPYKN